MNDDQLLHPIELAWRRARKALKGFDPTSDLQKRLPSYVARFAKEGLPDGVVFPSNLVLRSAYGRIVKTGDESVALQQWPTDGIPVWMTVGRHAKDLVQKSSNAEEDYLLSHGMAARIIANTAYAYAFWSGYRISKRIYRVDPVLWEGLVDAKFPGNYPARMIHLPSPAIALDLGNAFVETPGPVAGRGYDKVNLIYINLDLAADGESTGDRALNISVPFGSSDDQIQLVGSLNIDKHPTIQQCWDACVSRWKAHHMEVYSEPPPPEREMAFNRIVGGALNTILYIIGENEIAKTIHPGSKPSSAPSKAPNKVQRLAVDLAKPEELEIGGQYAAKAIEHWEAEADGGTTPNRMGHAIRPHIRSAHAHLYWTGPGKEIPVVKYLPPIAVKGAKGDERNGPALAPVR